MYVPEEVSADRAARASLREQRELAGETTAMFCGDPLPGYSALDRGPEPDRSEAGIHENTVTLASVRKYG